MTETDQTKPDNRLLKDKWTVEKRRLRRAGVYMISNRVTDEIYIGSSFDMFKRWNTHLSAIRLGKHACKRMSAIYAESGYDHPFDLFQISVLEETVYVIDREDYWMKKLKPTLNKNAAKAKKKYR